jgi:hypothetical protein
MVYSAGVATRTTVGKCGGADSDNASSAQAARDAKMYMKAARAAEEGWREKPHYDNWSIADDRYADAAEAYGKAGDKLNQQKAIAERNRLRQEYKQFVQKKKAPEKTKQLTKAQCDALSAQVAKIKQAGGDTSALEDSLAKTCN